MTIKSSCRPNRQIKIKKSSIVKFDQCPIEIEGKLYEKEEKSENEYVLEIPKIHLPLEANYNSTHIEVKRVNIEEIKNAQTAFKNIKFAKIEEDPMHITYWSLYSIPLIIVLIIIAILWKLRKGLTPTTHENQPREIREPAFSELQEGEVI